jgi:hypothetical protein
VHQSTENNHKEETKGKRRRAFEELKSAATQLVDFETSLAALIIKGLDKTPEGSAGSP